MRKLQLLFENNKKWSESIKEKNPHFFSKISKQQAPEYLWIGCSDSRVPANEIVGLAPGEIFVHRNIANLVVHSDLNCLSAIQFAVEFLKVKHIIVCGHYDCGGIKAAMENKDHGLIDNWLQHVKDVYHDYSDEIDAQENETDKCNLLCELNVIEQVLHVGRTSVVQAAWEKGQALTIHGLIYDITNGMLEDLDICISGNNGDTTYSNDE